jgi:hypothetical protein
MPAGFPLGLVERRVNALALGWLIYAAVIGVLGFFGLIFAHAALSGHMGPYWHGPFGGHLGRHWADHGLTGPGLPIFLHFAWVALLIRFGLALASGLGLMQKAPWGRWVAIVAGCLALIHMPFGTVLGIWTLIVLLNAPNALGYDVMARG